MGTQHKDSMEENRYLQKQKESEEANKREIRKEFKEWVQVEEMMADL